MTKLTRLSKWTITANLLIIIAAGHGAAPLLMIEPFLLSDFSLFEVSFALNGSYDNSIGAAVLFSMVGQLLMLTSIFIENRKGKCYVAVFGLLFMWTGYFYLSHALLWGDSPATFSFFTGLPFFILSILLCVRLNQMSRLIRRNTASNQ